MKAIIASIYFAPVKAERNFGGPYELPAVALGDEPATLTVEDCVQVEEGPYQLGQGGQRRSKNRFLVTGEAIARDIVGEWTLHGLGMTPQCRPGIWVVRETVPLLNNDGSPQVDANGVALWQPASVYEKTVMLAEDLEAARAADRAYANMLFQNANATAEDARLIPTIPKNAKLGARHYGMSAEWLRENASLDVKPCPFCTKVISARAIKCPGCSEIVNIDAYVSMDLERTQAIKLAKEAARSAA